MNLKNPTRAELSKYAGIGAGLVFCTGILLQVTRTLVSPPPGLTRTDTIGETVFFAALWGVAAYASFARKRNLVSVIVVGLVAFLGNFAVASAARGHVEIWYLAAIPIVAALEWAAFRGELILGHKEEPALPRVRGYMNV